MMLSRLCFLKPPGGLSRIHKIGNEELEVTGWTITLDVNHVVYWAR